MKKIILCTFFSQHSGGLESHFNSLKKYLEEANYVVKEKKMIKNKNYLKVIKYLLKNLSSINNLEILKNKILQNIYAEESIKNGDIYHFHDVLSLYSLRKLKNEKNKFILTVHGPLSRESKMMTPKNHLYIKYLEKIEKEAYQLADKIITVDTGQKNIVVDMYGIDPNKISVIFNAVDSNEFIHSKLEKKYILVPRRLVKKNGVDIAIKAMKYVAKNDLILKIAGSGIEMESLKALSKELGVEKNVEFLGDANRIEIKKLILESKAIIIPSVPSEGVIEATSISALEGMSAGKIVIASNIGGLKEIIKDKENGLLFKAGDFEELGRLINKILDNDFNNIKINARKYILENSCLEIWGRKVLKIYNEN